MEKIYFPLVAFFILSLAKPSAAQWQSTNGPDETDIYCIAASDSNIFAGGDFLLHLLPKSGGIWTIDTVGLASFGISSLAISGNNIYVGTCYGGGGVFLSSNNGRSWAATGLTHTSVSSLVISGNNIFAGTCNSVFLSTDNGNSWTEMNNGLPTQYTDTCITSLAISGSNIFAGTNRGGMFLSKDTGNSWVEVNNGITNFNILTLAISGNNIFAGTGGGVFLSADTGNNWIAINNGLTYYTQVLSLAINGSDILAGTSGGGVFLSTDTGKSWVAVNTGLTYLVVFSLAINENTIYAGTQIGGVWKRPLSELTGIKENKDNADYILFPNPVGNKIIITTNNNISKETTVSIISVTGKLMKKEIFKNQNLVEIDVSTLAKGIYIVKIQVEKEIINKKLIIR